MAPLLFQWINSIKSKSIFQVKKDAFPSHARHMVQVAQEKADLTEQSELLAKQIDKEEEELASLEQVKRYILGVDFKNSNKSDQNSSRICFF